MNENDDLDLLARFREDLPEATPQRLASVRAEYLKGRAVNARKPFFTPKRLAVAAIPAVAAVALGVAAIALNTGGTTPAGTGVNTAIEQHALDPNADAAAVLRYLSVTSAQHGDAKGINPGQLILEHENGTYRSVKDPGAGETPSESWIWWDPFASMAQRKYVTVENGEERVSIPSNKNGKTGEEQIDTPSVQSPSPEWVAALPSDPDAMIAQFREEFRKQVNWDWIGVPKSGEGHYAQPGTEEYQKAQDAADGMLFTDASRLLMISNYTMTAQQRATMWEALSKLKNVTRTDGTVTTPGGREGIAIGANAAPAPDGGGSRYEIIIDPQSSEVIGIRVLEADGTVRSFSDWETKLVDSVDDRG